MSHNIFNYQYQTLDKLLSKLDKIDEKRLELNKSLTSKITIQKSKHGYWNLKLEIYNERKSTEEVSVFSQRVG